MKIALGFVLGSLLAGSPAFAAPKTYQVTGPVLEVKDDVVVVQKGAEKWEIAKDKDTKVTGGELKAGAKATIVYRMTAASVEVKGGAPADKAGADQAGADKAAAGAEKGVAADKGTGKPAKAKK